MRAAADFHAKVAPKRIGWGWRLYSSEGMMPVASGRTMTKDKALHDAQRALVEELREADTCETVNGEELQKMGFR